MRPKKNFYKRHTRTNIEKQSIQSIHVDLWKDLPHHFLFPLVTLVPPCSPLLPLLPFVSPCNKGEQGVTRGNRGNKG